MWLLWTGLRLSDVDTAGWRLGVGATRWSLVALVVMASCVTAISASRAMAAARSCFGYCGCNSASYTTHGYNRTTKRRSYWAQYAGDNCTNYAAYLMVTIDGMPDRQPRSRTSPMRSPRSVRSRGGRRATTAPGRWGTSRTSSASGPTARSWCPRTPIPRTASRTTPATATTGGGSLRTAAAGPAASSTSRGSPRQRGTDSRAPRQVGRLRHLN